MTYHDFRDMYSVTHDRSIPLPSAVAAPSAAPQPPPTAAPSHHHHHHHRVPPHHYPPHFNKTHSRPIYPLPASYHPHYPHRLCRSFVDPKDLPTAVHRRSDYPHALPPHPHVQLTATASASTSAHLLHASVGSSISATSSCPHYDHHCALPPILAPSYPCPPTPIFVGTMTRDVFIKICTAYLDSCIHVNEPHATLPTHVQPESVFFSVSKPDISTEEYVRRLVNYTQCSPAAFIVMLVYLDRIATVNSRLKITAFNLHRLLVTALMLACKMLDDQCYSTLHYAKVGGIPTAREMNRLELQYLRYVDFRMHVPVEMFFTKQHDLDSLVTAL